MISNVHKKVKTSAEKITNRPGSQTSKENSGFDSGNCKIFRSHRPEREERRKTGKVKDN